jgi:RNA polymerase sigma-70 factor (ECF subfamily)
MFARTDMIASHDLLARVLHVSDVWHAGQVGQVRHEDTRLVDATHTHEAQLAQDDDVALMRRIGDGDNSAFRAMVDRYLQRIASFAQRLLGSMAEAEDVAQDTFLKLWTEASGFTPSAKPSTWLYRIAHTLCIDRLRRRRDADPAILDRQSGGDRPNELVSRKETAQAVTVALAELPERQRAALTLVHYEGFSNIEAAAVLDTGVDALESLLARGRRTLRHTLRGLHAEQESSE